MARITAIIGALFIFVVVFLAADFVAMHVVDGLPDWCAVAATGVAGLVALVPALASYRATLARSRGGGTGS